MIAFTKLLSSDPYFAQKLTFAKEQCTGDIAGVSSESFACKKDFLFVAIAGAMKNSRDGHDFIDDAIGRGAKAVVVDQNWVARPLPVPIIRADNSREALAYLCEAFYEWPSRSLNLIGITGTNGKTSTSFMVQSILNAAGIRASVMGTLGVGEPHNLSSLSHTTAPPEVLSATLWQLKASGISHLVMEVSSHAIALKRIAALRFSVVAFTNLSHDHLDFHGTMDAYRKTKEALFSTLTEAHIPKIVPIDHPFDPSIELLAGTRLFDPEQSVPVNLPFFTAIHRNNANLAVHIARALGIDEQSIAKGLSQCAPVSGRLEPIFVAGPTVLVDFAHSPDALEKVLKALKAHTKGKLIVVFGCGGDRDHQKRPLMGTIASSIADTIIITDDNPRSEDPASIRAAIVTGVQKTCDMLEIGDRKEAIFRAIALAKREDLVLIAGKGHEQYQIKGAQTIAFSDQKEALWAVEQLCKT